MNTNVTPATEPNRMQTLRSRLDNPIVKASLKQVLPKFLTPDRLIRIALANAARTPKLLECTPESILKSVMQAAQLGLEAGSAIGSGYLVPYRNTKRKGSPLEAQFIPGYRGLIDLARRSGQVLSIAAYVIHKNDTFDLDYGRAENPVIHKPTLSDDPGDMIAVWAVARLVGGGVQTDVMTKKQVDAIKNRSRAQGDGPWITDYEEMARKTIVRRICKYLPLSVEPARGLATALAMEERVENGESTADLFDVQLPTGEAPEDEDESTEPAAIGAAKTDEVTEALKAKRNAKLKKLDPTKNAHRMEQEPKPAAAQGASASTEPKADAEKKPFCSACGGTKNEKGEVVHVKDCPEAGE